MSLTSRMARIFIYVINFLAKPRLTKKIKTPNFGKISNLKLE